MRVIKNIFIHCAGTPDDSEHIFTIEEIDSWHIPRGFKRKPEMMAKFNPKLKAIGYHYVIYRDGSRHTGRAEAEIGAHAEGFNAKSIGICLIGMRKFTPAQWNELEILLEELQTKYPDAAIFGHYQVAKNGKTCPNFDVPAYVENGYCPADTNIYVA